jgi:hypothetical protein
MMPSPFPGMDPYLEQPDHWPEYHSRLIVAIADALMPQLRPKYEVAIEKHIYEVNTFEGESGLLVGIPDVAVNQRTQTRSEPDGSSNLATESASSLSKPITVNEFLSCGLRPMLNLSDFTQSSEGLPHATVFDLESERGREQERK